MCNEDTGNKKKFNLFSSNQSLEGELIFYWKKNEEPIW